MAILADQSTWIYSELDLLKIAPINLSVIKHGLGQDMWKVPFDDITYILYVRLLQQLQSVYT